METQPLAEEQLQGSECKGGLFLEVAGFSAPVRSCFIYAAENLVRTIAQPCSHS